MALNANTLENDIKGPLAAELKTELSSVLQIVAGAGDTQLQLVCTAIANATAKIAAQKIVSHLKSSAQVQATVMTGAGAGGQVSGVIL